MEKSVLFLNLGFNCCHIIVVLDLVAAELLIIGNPFKCGGSQKGPTAGYREVMFN
jgi:hypothetical protein